MKIVPFKDFLALPEGTLYHDYLLHDSNEEGGDIYTFEALRVKGATCSETEYEAAKVSAPSIEFDFPLIVGEALREARLSGGSVKLKYGEFVRFTETPLYQYAVYEPEDVDGLAKFLGPTVRAAREAIPLLEQIKRNETGEERLVWPIDEWLDFGAIHSLYSNPGLAYAHFFFMQKRMAAWIKAAHSPFMRQFKLYVDYGGYTYRVTGASRMGDVWLSTNLTDEDPQPYYDHRVEFDLSKLTNWRDHPGEEPMVAPKPVEQRTSPVLRNAPCVNPHAKVKTSGRHYKHVGDFREGDIIHLTPEGGAHVKPGDKLYVRTK